MATSTPVSWSIKDLQELNSGDGSGGKLVIPTYQRGLRWNDRRRKELIESIQKGHPVGSLLIWEQTRDNEKQYHLIDGLQRTNSILRYLESPLSDFDPDWIDGSELEDLIRIVFRRGPWNESDYELGRAEIKAQISLWLSETKSITNSSKFNPTPLLVSIFEGLHLDIDYEVIQPESEFSQLAATLIDAIKAKSDIESYSMPVIVYEGPPETLADIFEKINSNGVALTKYDRLAAAWGIYKTKINDLNIRGAIRSKYAALENEGFELADYDPNDPDQYNLYEYLFGLGKYLAEKYPKFVQGGSDPFDVESLAFSVATVVHQVKIPDMSDLPGNFNKTGDFIDPTIFQIGLEEAFERYDEIVRPIYSLQLNTKNTEVKIPIPEFQLSSYISRIFSGKYDTASNFETRSNFEEDWVELTQGIRESFLIDTLNQYWRGSGDSKVFDRVWSSPTSESITLNSAYTLRRDRNTWENILNNWFGESLESRQKDRSSIRPPEKIFLRYIYMKLVSVFDNANEKFELDHVIPIHILKSLIPEEDEGWPLSNIANLTLLPSLDNARKSVDTLQAYLLRLASEGKQEQVEKITKLAVSPINICDVPSSGSGIEPDREWYLGFLKERFEYMKEAFYDAMGIADST